MSADLVLPAGAAVTAVNFSPPESPEPVDVAFTRNGDRVRFRVPRFLVYAVARVRL